MHALRFALVTCYRNLFTSQAGPVCSVGVDCCLDGLPALQMSHLSCCHSDGGAEDAGHL